MLANTTRGRAAKNATEYGDKASRIERKVAVEYSLLAQFSHGFGLIVALDRIKDVLTERCSVSFDRNDNFSRR